MPTPVIYVFFNRPEVTRRTFSALRQIRPARLHLIADGPRANRPEEAVRCRESRAVVESLLDWNCQVTRDYSDVNLGCGRRLATGLSAAFAQLGEAIVLEDDILPHPDFFPFCDAMLQAYRNDPHIHAISGFQPLGRYAPRQGPVVPSTFSPIWGWASWQRAWQDYRFDIGPVWQQAETRDRFREYLGNELSFYEHSCSFDDVTAGRVDTWDFQWNFTLLAQRRVNLVSSVNLIHNLGFDVDATHTTQDELYLRNLRVHASVPTPRRRNTARPDRVHDKLYGEVIHGRSRGRVAALRLLARFPGLARRVLKT